MKLSRVPLGAPFSICKSCRQHASWHPSLRQMLHTKAPSLCVGFSRQSVGGDTASNNCRRVWCGVVKTKDGDRGLDGEHRPGSPEEGHTLDRGGCGWMAGDRCHGRHSQNGSGPANHDAAFGAQPHVPSSDDDHHQPTTPRRGTPTSRSRSRPRRTASLLPFLPSERAVLSGALFRGAHHASPPRAWDGFTKSHSFHTKQPIPAVPGPPRDPPPQPSSPAAGHSHAVPPLRLNSRYIPSTCLDSPPCRTPPVDRLRVPLCISITVCFGRADTMILSLK